MVSYRWSVATIALTCTVIEIWDLNYISFLSGLLPNAFYYRPTVSQSRRRLGLPPDSTVGRYTTLARSSHKALGKKRRNGYGEGKESVDVGNLLQRSRGDGRPLNRRARFFKGAEALWVTKVGGKKL